MTMRKAPPRANPLLPPLPSGEGLGEGELRETHPAEDPLWCRLPSLHSCGTATPGCVPPDVAQPLPAVISRRPISDRRMTPLVTRASSPCREPQPIELIVSTELLDPTFQPPHFME